MKNKHNWAYFLFLNDSCVYKRQIINLCVRVVVIYCLFQFEIKNDNSISKKVLTVFEFVIKMFHFQKY